MRFLAQPSPAFLGFFFPVFPRFPVADTRAGPRHGLWPPSHQECQPGDDIPSRKAKGSATRGRGKAPEGREAFWEGVGAAPHFPPERRFQTLFPHGCTDLVQSIPSAPSSPHAKGPLSADPPIPRIPSFPRSPSNAKEFPF